MLFVCGDHGGDSDGGDDVKPVQTIEKLRGGIPVTIVALGDSLTDGWMVDRGYLDFLETMIDERYRGSKYDLVNRGISGDTAEGGLQRLERDVLALHPDCVFVQFALNDAFSGYSPDEYEGYVEAIIRGIREGSPADILLITSVCLSDARQDDIVTTFYDRLDELAQRHDLPIVRVHEYWKSTMAAGTAFGDLTLPDGAHPNERGYRLMAEAIMASLV